MSSEWFAEGGIYASLHKYGEVVQVYSTWHDDDWGRFAAGVWVLGPRTGDSWARHDRGDIFHAYEKVEANPWGTDNQTTSQTSQTSKGDS